MYALTNHNEEWKVFTWLLGLGALISCTFKEDTKILRIGYTVDGILMQVSGIYGGVIH